MDSDARLTLDDFLAERPERQAEIRYSPTGARITPPHIAREYLAWRLAQRAGPRLAGLETEEAGAA